MEIRRSVFRKLRDERGVAMVAVLFVAAALTAASSAAAYVAITEFGSAGADQRGSQALGYAEAGIDRLILLLRGDTWEWEEIMRSGCDDENGNGDVTDDDLDDVVLGPGTGDDLVFVSGLVGGRGNYRAELRHEGCPSPVPSPRRPQQVTITGIGEHPSARRVVEQVIELRPKGLPVGLYANSSISSGGVGSEPEVTNISVVTPGFIDNRDRMAFVGTDPYWTKDDFYDNGDSAPIPAAAHAAGDIYCKNKTACGDDYTEHLNTDRPLNCTANIFGTAGQSAYDGSKNGTTIPSAASCAGYAGGKPPRSSFSAGDLQRVAPAPALEDDDVDALIDRAKTAGLYCTYSGNKGTCTVAGGTPFSAPPTFTTTDVYKSGLPQHFVAYFDFPTATNPNPTANINTVNWNANVAPLCSSTTTERSVVMLIPNGSLSVQSGNTISGAVFAEKGSVDVAGGATVHGTIIADEINMQGGANFLLDTCWLDQMPFAFLQINPVSWSQVDR